MPNSASGSSPCRRQPPNKRVLVLSHRKIKHQVLDLLKNQDLAEILKNLQSLPAKDGVNALFSAICRDEPRVKWFAVTCMGVAVARLAAQDMEEARIVMRRLLWSLNDESGGIGWGAPESMAEIMCQNRPLAEEYAHMLVSYMREDGEELCQDGNFIEHPLLQRGVLWGGARMSGCHPDLMNKMGVAGDLEQYLRSPDLEIRGLAVLAAGILPCEQTRALLEQVAPDTQPFILYRDGSFHQVTMVELLQSARCEKVEA